MRSVRQTLQKAIKAVPFVYIRIKAAQLARWADDDDHRLRFYATLIKPGDLCFDVGANFGNRVKIFLKIGAKVIAVEPLSECIQTLKMVYENRPDLVLVPKAVGPMEAEAEIHIPEVTVIASMSPGWIAAVQKSGRFRESSWKETRRIQVTTLDKLISKYGEPDFIKIDVEGFEYEVIRGLSQPVKMVSLEFTAEYIEPAISSVEHLACIGNFEFNYYIGEDMVFALKEWVSPNEIKQIMKQMDLLAWGDVYARRKRSDSKAA